DVCSCRSRAHLPRLMLFVIALLPLPFCPLPATEDQARAAHARASSRRESTVDMSTKPGDDFFGYANGEGLKAAVIPAGKNRWSVRDGINELTRRHGTAIFGDASSSPPGARARKGDGVQS